ncbi:MAG: hypothetical protein JWR07_2033 [Nevskia sp.]|nr:hypothetical protein [Nevskia sp.]
MARAGECQPEIVSHYFLKNPHAFVRLIRWALVCHIFGQFGAGICDIKFTRKDEAAGTGNSETWAILAAPRRCLVFRLFK